MMPAEYQAGAGYRVQLRYHLGRAILRPAIRLLLKLLSPVQITGRANIPPAGAYLIAINHVSIFEPPLVLSFWPVTPEAAGAVEIWERPGQSLLIRLYGGIPVQRGTYNREMLAKMVAALRAGRPALLAPEGGRTHTPGMRRANPGIAYIAEKSGAPVLPVGLVGTTDDYLQRALRGQRPPLAMHIGELFHLPALPAAGLARRQALQENADLVMRRIAALLPPEYRGVYG